nr:zinc finger BED domain-containing protein RICESLEEPER 2-like [Tanacetum cinerariifolium]
MDNGDAHPMNIDDESDDSVEEIGKPTQSEGVAKYEGVRDVVKYLEPDVTHITRNTTKADMLKLHKVESKRLRDELLCCPSRICLTSDAWTSIVTDSYLSLAAYYLDKNWLYGNDSPQLAKVKEVLYGVFDEYNLASKNATSSTSGGGGNEMNSQMDEGDGGTTQCILKEFDLFDKNESLRSNEKHLASESAFSLGGRILNQYQSSMKPATVEALICTRDWIFSNKVASHATDLEEVIKNIMTLDIDKDEE